MFRSPATLIRADEAVRAWQRRRRKTDDRREADLAARVWMEALEPRLLLTTAVLTVIDPAAGTVRQAGVRLAGPGSDVASVAVAPGGKAVLLEGGPLSGDPVGPLVIDRSNPDGSPDSSFGDAGRVTASFAEGGLVARFVGVLDDGRVVAAGELVRPGGAGDPNANSLGLLVARFNPDGSPDLTFGRAGHIVLPTNRYAYLWDTGADAVAGDGRVYLTAIDKAANANNQDIYNLDGPLYAVRLDAAGRLDPAFGAGGVAATPAPADGLFLAQPETALAPDGGLWVAALLCDQGTLGQGELYYRFDAGGRLASRFIVPAGQPGSAVGFPQMSQQLAAGPDGKLVVYGDDGSISRFLPDGTPDPSFAVGSVDVGRALWPLGWGDTSGLKSLGLQPDGRVVAFDADPVPQYNPAGPSKFSPSLATRWNADGSPDATFGTAGILTAGETVPLDPAVDFFDAVSAVGRDGTLAYALTGLSYPSDAPTPDPGDGANEGGGAPVNPSADGDTAPPVPEAIADGQAGPFTADRSALASPADPAGLSSAAAPGAEGFLDAGRDRPDPSAGLF